MPFGIIYCSGPCWYVCTKSGGVVLLFRCQFQSVIQSVFQATPLPVQLIPAIRNNRASGAIMPSCAQERRINIGLLPAILIVVAVQVASKKYETVVTVQTLTIEHDDRGNDRLSLHACA